MLVAAGAVKVTGHGAALGLRRAGCLGLHFGRQGQALSQSYFIVVGGRGRVLLALLRLLELGVQVCVDAEGLHALIVLNLRRALPRLLRILRLPHTCETLGGLVVRTAHNVSPWREHALNLAILTVNKLVAARALNLRRALACQIVASRRLLRSRAATATDALPTSAEEALHAV